MNLNRCTGMVAVAMLAIILASGGCDSRGEYVGLGGLFEGMMPPSPTQAAKDVFNPYDPDLRRKSVTLISNAPFGGASAARHPARIRPGHWVRPFFCLPASCPSQDT